MTLHKHNNDIVDKAWNSLYSRLEDEGLLASTYIATKQSSRFSVSLKLTVSIALIAAAIAVFFVVVSNNKTNNFELLMMYNDKETTTLVKTLNDGSIVYLANNTKLHYPKQFFAQKREVFLEGSAFFDVAKNKDHPFFIETELMQIEVLGTAFNVDSKNNAPFSLSVQRGEVKVILKENGQAVYVKAGQTAILQSQKLQTIATDKNNQLTRYTSQMRFKDEPLANIVKVINKNADDIIIELDEILNDKLLTVTFTNETPTVKAQLICLALNLQYTQQQNIIRIYQPK